jgi:signal peptidase I
VLPGRGPPGGQPSVSGQGRPNPYSFPIDTRHTSRLARLVGEKRGPLFELIFIVAFAVSLALAVESWAVKPFQIPSESMEPTLDIGQRVLVNRFIYHFRDPQVGDIVVFHPPAGVENEQQCGVDHGAREPCPESTPERSDTNFIKRIVAEPGDRLKIVRGIPIVDGKPVEGDWRILPCRSARAPCTYSRPITIPADHYFMMGDNRPASDDSRFWGPVPRDWIIGQAFLTYWPPDRLGPL